MFREIDQPVEEQKKEIVDLDESVINLEAVNDHQVILTENQHNKHQQILDLINENNTSNIERFRDQEGIISDIQNLVEKVNGNVNDTLIYCKKIPNIMNEKFENNFNKIETKLDNLLKISRNKVDKSVQDVVDKKFNEMEKYIDEKFDGIKSFFQQIVIESDINKEPQNNLYSQSNIDKQIKKRYFSVYLYLFRDKKSENKKLNESIMSSEALSVSDNTPCSNVMSTDSVISVDNVQSLPIDFSEKITKKKSIKCKFCSPYT